DAFTTTTYTVTVTRRTPYEDWIAANSLTGPNSAADEDFDGDGASNFMEFALNTDPRVPSAALLPIVTTTVNPSDNEHYPTITYRRRITPGTLTYVIRSSPNLGTWTDVPGSQLEQIGPADPVGDETTETVTFRILPSLEDAPSRRFLRLKISN
ncbi:MAG: hypothetical protein ABMA01_17420, partial [Chthoniobacteraceae bacterium]